MTVSSSFRRIAVFICACVLLCAFAFSVFSVSAGAEQTSDLDNAINGAISALEQAAGDDPSDTVKGLLEVAEAAIRGATTVAEVSSLTETHLGLIQKQLKKEKTEAELLSLAKELAIRKLTDSFGENPEPSAQIVLDAAVQKINDVKSFADFRELTGQDLGDMVAETAAEILEAEALLAAKTKAISVIDEIMADEETVSEEMQAVVDHAKEEINAVTELEAIETVITEQVQAILLQKGKEVLEEAKQKAFAKLDEAAGENPSAVVRLLVATAKAAINAATDPDTVRLLVDSGLIDIKGQQNSEDGESTAGCASAVAPLSFAFFLLPALAFRPLIRRRDGENESDF